MGSQVSCHILVFPQALMENGGMEWEEIYGTNPSRVLKTLASAAASLPPSRPTKAQREGSGPANPLPPRPSVRSLEKTRTQAALTPSGGFWPLIFVTTFANSES